jgi:pimeloyl-ACP methyl ester carboxylesterase
MGSDSRTLLLAFGGLQGRIGMPPFEFLRLTGEFPVKRLFVRDVRQAWYHRGTPEYGETIEAVAESLGELISSHRVERLVTAGNSAGAYAALRFAASRRRRPSISARSMRSEITAGTRPWSRWCRPVRSRSDGPTWQWRCRGPAAARPVSMSSSMIR